MNCLFCDIIEGKKDKLEIYQDDLVIVILDAFPDSDGHSLIIPKKHYTDFTDIPNEVLIHINEISKKYTKILMNKLNAKGMKIIVNYGSTQLIKHYHMHLIPIYETISKNTERIEIYNRIMN